MLYTVIYLNKKVNIEYNRKYRKGFCRQLYKQPMGLREDSEISGFLRIGKVGLLKGYKVARSVRAPHRGYKYQKIYCENTKKPATSDSSLNPKCTWSPQHTKVRNS